MKLKLPVRFTSALISGDITSSDLDREDVIRIEAIIDAHGPAVSIKTLGRTEDPYTGRLDMIGEYTFHSHTKAILRYYVEGDALKAEMRHQVTESGSMLILERHELNFVPLEELCETLNRGLAAITW